MKDDIITETNLKEFKTKCGEHNESFSKEFDNCKDKKRIIN